MFRKIPIFLINIYQKTISKVKGQTCVFYPTCSEYAKEAIAIHGVYKGMALGIKRLGKCHPWQENKIDKVPASLTDQYN